MLTKGHPYKGNNGKGRAVYSHIFIFRFGEVLKCAGTVCAVFMVKTWLCNTWTESFALISSNTLMEMMKDVYTVAPSQIRLWVYHTSH